MRMTMKGASPRIKGGNPTNLQIGLYSLGNLCSIAVTSFSEGVEYSFVQLPLSVIGFWGLFFSVKFKVFIESGNG